MLYGSFLMSLAGHHGLPGYLDRQFRMRVAPVRGERLGSGFGGWSATRTTGCRNAQRRGRGQRIHANSAVRCWLAAHVSQVAS